MQLAAPNLIPALAELFVLLMACIVLLADLFVEQNYRGIVTFFLTELTLLGAAVITIILYSLPNTHTFFGMYVHDPLTSLLNLLIYITAFFAFIYARKYIHERNFREGEYYVLGLFSVLGMTVLVSGNNLLVLFLGLELLSLPLYTMIAMQRESGIATEASMKYFIMGAMATGIILYGMSMLFGISNSLNLQTIAQAVTVLPLNQQVIALLALVFIVVGLAFKLGAAPFHMWAPDVYDGAATPVTLFIGSAPKIAALGMLIRLLIDAMPALHLEWQHLFIVIALISMALGNVVAIVQSNLKRMLAYSSIAHMGYMLLGILSGTNYGYGASIFYIIVYVIMAVGAFAIITIMSRAGMEADKISDLRGLNSRNPWLALMMLLIMFSMAGIPPTVGFFAKLGVLESLIRSDLVWLAAVALVFAVIGSYYYIAIVKVMYFEEPDKITPIPLSWDLRVAISINGLAIIILGIFPTALIDLCRQAITMS